MHVQYADANDLSKLVPLFKGYLQFYKRPHEDEAVETFVKKRLKNGDAIILIAMKDGEAIGFTQLYPNFSTLHLKRCYVLNDLYVNPTYRKLGAGQALLDEAFAFCKEMGAAQITLDTQPENKEAKRLYEKNDMVHDEEFWRYIKEF